MTMINGLTPPTLRIGIRKDLSLVTYHLSTVNYRHIQRALTGKVHAVDSIMGNNMEDVRTVADKFFMS